MDNENERSEDERSSKIDLKSGFMKHIIRNQQNRDDYDKEVKQLQEMKKNPRSVKENRNQTRRPPRGLYVPPTKGNKDQPGSSSSDRVSRNVFKLQYEGPDGEVSELLVNKADNPYHLAERCGRQYDLAQPLIQALGSIIEEEMDKRWLQT